MQLVHNPGQEHNHHDGDVHYLAVVLVDSKMCEFIEVGVVRVLELEREQGLAIISLHRDHLKFVLLCTFSNLVAERAVTKHKVVVVSILIDCNYRHC